MEKVQAVLGIDIGGTNTKFGLVNSDGKIIKRTSAPTHPEQGPHRFFDRLHRSTMDLFDSIKQDYELVAVGIGAPNANYYQGTIENPPNLGWGCVEVVKILHTAYHLPVFITNDANATAMGEMLFGAAKDMKDVIVITLGTGLGSGIIVNGKIVYGADGFAGEMGHTCIVPNGRLCGCGNLGCLETYVSATGITKTVTELLKKDAHPSPLRAIDKDDLTAKIISETAADGDVISQEAFKFTGELLGLSLANAVAILRPEAIILFGGLAAAGDLLLEPVKKSFERHLLPLFRGKIPIMLSGLTDGSAAILGAAALAWNELKCN